MPELTLIEAVTQALAYELNADKRVILFGEDIAKNGGVFRATIGLAERFGTDRVRDTPLAENLIAGLAVGLAVQGLRPVAEIQFDGFMYASFDQIISHASRMRNRTRGRLSCPMVIRAPYGGGIRAPEHHSESTEALFAHIPGLRVVIPSSPAKSYGLLLAAIRDPDPVIFLEPKRVYRKVKQMVADDGVALALDHAYKLKEGTDLSFIAWGAMIYETQLAIEQLEAEGLSCELIDLATIKPMDSSTILESVAKTGRCVIVQEAARTCSVGSEIAALLAEKGLTSLLAPVGRVSGYDTIMPLFRLEEHYMPSVAKIISCARRTMEYA